MTETLERLFEKLKFKIHGEDADAGCDCHICLEIDQLQKDLTEWAEKNAVVLHDFVNSDRIVTAKGVKAVPLSLIRESLRSQRHEPQDEFKEKEVKE